MAIALPVCSLPLTVPDQTVEYRNMRVKLSPLHLQTSPPVNKVLLLKLFYPVTVQEVLHTGSLLGHVRLCEWHLHEDKTRSDLRETEGPDLCIILAKSAGSQKCPQCLVVLIGLVYKEICPVLRCKAHMEDRKSFNSIAAEGTETFTEAAVKLGTCLNPLITVPAAPVTEAGEMIINLTQHLSKSC